jgi:hypothetical protein
MFGTIASRLNAEAYIASAALLLWPMAIEARSALRSSWAMRLLMATIRGVWEE